MNFKAAIHLSDITLDSPDAKKHHNYCLDTQVFSHSKYNPGDSHVQVETSNNFLRITVGTV